MSNAHWSYEEIKKRHDQYEEQITTLKRENEALNRRVLDEVKDAQTERGIAIALKREWENDGFDKGYTKCSKFVDELEARIVNLVVDNIALETENATLKRGIAEAKLQIVYLHEKFQETGSGNAVLAKIDTLLMAKENE